MVHVLFTDHKSLALAFHKTPMKSDKEIPVIDNYVTDILHIDRKKNIIADCL